jgi:hypothetical protein
MGVRSARLSDLVTIQRLDRIDDASVLSHAMLDRQPSAVILTLMSNWRSVGQRTETLVMAQGTGVHGFVQARARPGRESWNIVRLACVAPDIDAWEAACSSLIDRISAATAQHGALRTFARVPAESSRIVMLGECAFRQYATEISHRGTLSTLVARSADSGSDVRVRHPRDAWDIFSLYCAVTPALVRHAEGRSLKEWLPTPRLWPTVRRWQFAREAVMGDPGNLQAWIRWEPARKFGYQSLDILARPEAVKRMGELLRFASENLSLDLNCPTICRAREYDGRISATLEGAGFDSILRETLLVRHTVARVTERQLLVAALRAQGLGIDLSQYRSGAEAIHQLSSNRETELYHNDHYDRYDRASYHG